MPKLPVSREGILAMAENLIANDRADQYGDAFDTHSRIAAMWSAVLGASQEPDKREITAAEVALLMVCVKVIRAQKNPGYVDSWIDIAGYAALGGEMAR